MDGDLGTARAWLASRLADLPLEVERDAAGNDWYTLRGDSERAVLIGGHLDSVPNGGWLDGCLNVVAGAEVLRRIAEEGTPPVTVRLVDWADEEGARFGRSLFGSSRRGAARWPTRTSCASSPTATASRLPEAIGAYGVDLDRALDARAQLESAAAYLELHIEQGPVLESLDLPLGVVLGTFGVERHRITWTGQAAHAGSTPMDQRRDALAGAAKLALAIRDIARETGDGAVCTSGGVDCRPGIVTSVVETAEQLLDQRHLDAGKLATMLVARAGALARVREGGARSTSSGSGSGRSSRSSSTTTLIGFADDAIREVAGPSHRLPSGPLHDAAEVRRAGRPDGDALRAEPARPLAHEARGHEARAPRARRRHPRPSRLEDDRVGRR